MKLLNELDKLKQTIEKRNNTNVEKSNISHETPDNQNFNSEVSNETES